jgi:hypothetical protein
VSFIIVLAGRLRPSRIGKEAIYGRLSYLLKALVWLIVGGTIVYAIGALVYGALVYPVVG